MAERLKGGPVGVGGQDCHAGASGPFTGDIAAVMLADAGARYVIVGHSERRAAHGETDGQVAAKALAAISAGLEPIICVGETQAQKAAGETLEVLRRQVAGSCPEPLTEGAFAVAYEPVWAIGGDRTPSPPEIEAAHGAIRAVLSARFGAHGAGAPILYGGAVSGDNARQILSLEGVSGLLVGRASLCCEDFLPIVRAADGLAAPIRV
jgi:triosephosphate isomerase